MNGFDDNYNADGTANIDPTQNDQNIQNQNTEPAPAVQTYVVTETRHTDTYTGGMHTYTAQTGAYAGSGSSQTQSVTRTAGRERTGGFRLNAVALIAICLVCAILGGAACLGGYRWLTRGARENSDVVASATESGSSGTDTQNLSKTDNTGTPSATASPNATAVTINVDGVSSPATAVAQKVLPSVVGIQVIVTSSSYWYGTTTSGGEGSGVIFSEDGYIITNYHVVSSVMTTAGETNPNATLSVFLYSDPDTAIPGTVIGYDQGADLAVVKIDKTGLTPVEIGDSDKILVGDTAIAIGNPGGLRFLGSVSQGIISGLNREIQIDTTYENLRLIQTDAAINPGNSGGALTDVNGRLIGINSAKVSVEGYEGMGFAIPVNDVVRICTDIIKNGNTRLAYLGVELNSQYSAAYLEKLGYPGGLLVNSVIEGSPAEKAGITADDIIVEFNGTKVTTAEELAALKNQCAPGDQVKIRLYRLTSSRFGRWTGEYMEVNVILG